MDYPEVNNPLWVLFKHYRAHAIEIADGSLLDSPRVRRLAIADAEAELQTTLNMCNMEQALKFLQIRSEDEYFARTPEALDARLTRLEKLFSELQASAARSNGQ